MPEEALAAEQLATAVGPVVTVEQLPPPGQEATGSTDSVAGLYQRICEVDFKICDVLWVICDVERLTCDVLFIR